MVSSFRTLIGRLLCQRTFSFAVLSGVYVDINYELFYFLNQWSHEEMFIALSIDCEFSRNLQQSALTLLNGEGQFGQ